MLPQLRINTLGGLVAADAMCGVLRHTGEGVGRRSEVRVTMSSSWSDASNDLPPLTSVIRHGIRVTLGGTSRSIEEYVT